MMTLIEEKQIRQQCREQYRLEGTFDVPREFCVKDVVKKHGDDAIMVWYEEVKKIQQEDASNDGI